MRSPEADAARDRGPVVALLLAAFAITFVAVVLLLPYAGQEEPGRSYDTPYYVWRTRAVASDGLGVLTTIPREPFRSARACRCSERHSVT